MPRKQARNYLPVYLLPLLPSPSPAPSFRVAFLGFWANKWALRACETPNKRSTYGTEFIDMMCVVSPSVGWTGHRWNNGHSGRTRGRGRVEEAHNEQILNDFGLVYVHAVCEIAFIDEPLPEERSISPTPPPPSPYTLLCPALQKFMQFGQERTQE